MLTEGMGCVWEDSLVLLVIKCFNSTNKSNLGFLLLFGIVQKLLSHGGCGHRGSGQVLLLFGHLAQVRRELQTCDVAAVECRGRGLGVRALE